jgi:hypothetical protein
MDRKYTRFKRALINIYSTCVSIAKNYILPAAEETGYFLSQVLNTILKGLEKKIIHIKLNSVPHQKCFPNPIQGSAWMECGVYRMSTALEI